MKTSVGHNSVKICKKQQIHQQNKTRNAHNVRGRNHCTVNRQSAAGFVYRQNAVGCFIGEYSKRGLGG